MYDLKIGKFTIVLLLFKYFLNQEYFLLKMTVVKKIFLCKAL